MPSSGWMTLKRADDLLPKIHGTDFIVQKWQGATLHGQGRGIRIEVDCPQAMAISECCVEFGALDRILYNLLNNACRHAASDRIASFCSQCRTPTDRTSASSY